MANYTHVVFLGEKRFVLWWTMERVVNRGPHSNRAILCTEVMPHAVRPTLLDYTHSSNTVFTWHWTCWVTCLAPHCFNYEKHGASKLDKP